MSANPKNFLTSASSLPATVTAPFPGSRKIYVNGSRADLRVGMREVIQQPTPLMHGNEANPPIPVYDTSGPYTDPDAHIDLRKGLAPLRAKWIAERNDSVHDHQAKLHHPKAIDQLCVELFFVLLAFALIRQSQLAIYTASHSIVAELPQQ